MGVATAAAFGANLGTLLVGAAEQGIIPQHSIAYFEDVLTRFAVGSNDAINYISAAGAGALATYARLQAHLRRLAPG